MKCIKCGCELPEDSEFCQYCGINILEYTKATNVKVISKSKRIKRAPTLTLLIVLCISIIINLYQLSIIDDYSSRIKQIETNSIEINNKITQLEIEKSSLEKELKYINNINNSNKENSLKYSNIISIADNLSFGYASDNFHVDKAIIVLENNKYSSENITLTANWPNGGTVSIDYPYSYTAAEVSFDENTWSESTTLTITPKNSGIGVATFTNSIDFQRFSILIIVK